jgi:2,3-dimethylmalate lyase
MPSPALRRALEEQRFVVAPGVFDVTSAKVADGMGFTALYVTGFGTVASHLGLPDAGIATYTDMIGRVRTFASGCRTPIIADADTGYGGLLNVRHTVAGYEAAGIAGIQLEDQVMPKKCGHMSGKALIGADEMAGKLRAAVAARRDPDLVLIARTDAVAVTGVDDALARARAYADAGADLLFVEAPTSEADIERVATELRDVAPLVFNWAEGGRTPPISMARMTELGFSLVIYPIGTLLAATAGIRSVLETLRRDGVPSLAGLPSFGEFTDLIGLPEVQDLEQRFGG